MASPVWPLAITKGPDHLAPYFMPARTRRSRLLNSLRGLLAPISCKSNKSEGMSVKPELKSKLLDKSAPVQDHFRSVQVKTGLKHTLLM